MSTVKIGTDERPLDNATPQWINQQINNRRDDGESVCVIVRLRDPYPELNLATPTCGGGGAGQTKQYSDRESAILALWREGMGQTGFTGGDLVAFLARLKTV